MELNYTRAWYILLFLFIGAELFAGSALIYNIVQASSQLSANKDISCDDDSNMSLATWLTVSVIGDSLFLLTYMITMCVSMYFLLSSSKKETQKSDMENDQEALLEDNKEDKFGIDTWSLLILIIVGLIWIIFSVVWSIVGLMVLNKSKGCEDDAKDIWNYVNAIVLMKIYFGIFIGGSALGGFVFKRI